MNKYELMYIIDTSLEEAARKELVDRITTLIEKNGGEVEKVDEWGKRRLAYPINYKNEGYYVLVNFLSGSDLPKEIERVLQISESILRYLVVRLEHKRSSVKPRAIPVRPAIVRLAETETESEHAANEPGETEETPIEDLPAPAVEVEPSAPADEAEESVPPTEAETE